MTISPNIADRRSTGRKDKQATIEALLNQGWEFDTLLVPRGRPFEYYCLLSFEFVANKSMPIWDTERFRISELNRLHTMRNFPIIQTNVYFSFRVFFKTKL